MKATDSSPEKRRASSIASLITTGGGRQARDHLVDRQTQDVAVHGGHALDAPVLGVLCDAAVDLGGVLDGAADQLLHERVGLRRSSFSSEYRLS